MAYNEKLADRIREIIAVTHKQVEEKKMFSGLCFMVNDKMCIGVHEDKIMVRLDPAVYDTVIEKEGCSPMDFTGKPMKGFVFVEEKVLNTKKQLDYWVQLALEFNKIARSSKKKQVARKSKNKQTLVFVEIKNPRSFLPGIPCQRQFYYFLRVIFISIILYSFPVLGSGPYISIC